VETTRRATNAAMSAMNPLFLPIPMPGSSLDCLVSLIFLSFLCGFPRSLQVYAAPTCRVAVCRSGEDRRSRRGERGQGLTGPLVLRGRLHGWCVLRPRVRAGGWPDDLGRSDSQETIGRFSPYCSPPPRGRVASPAPSRPFPRPRPSPRSPSSGTSLYPVVAAARAGPSSPCGAVIEQVACGS
jgi:hypothetical protein